MKDADQSDDSGALSRDQTSKAPVREQNSTAPEQHQVINHYIGAAKKFWCRFFYWPGARLIKWLDSHNGLLTAFATVAIAVLTYFVAVFANGQLKVFSDQLEEMQSTGKQTDDLIEANRKLAEAATKQAEAATGQIVVMQNQLNAMEANQRPWIKVEPEQGELPFDITHGIGAIPFHAKVTNTGHSPGLNVRIFSSGFIPTKARSDVVAEQKERCAKFIRAALSTALRISFRLPQKFLSLLIQSKLFKPTSSSFS